jgi:hypothetical protein
LDKVVKVGYDRSTWHEHTKHREGRKHKVIFACKQERTELSYLSQVTMTYTDTQHSSTSPTYKENGTIENGRTIQSNQEQIEATSRCGGRGGGRNFDPTPPKIFHKDYLPPRKDDTPPITVLVNAKYPLPIAPVPKGISRDEDMLDKVANLKFMDHNITNT